MNRPHHPEKLHDYVDGTLAIEDTRVLEAHLATCSVCHAELDSLRRLRFATAALPRELTPGRDLWPELAARLHAPAHPVAAKVSEGSAHPSLARILFPLAVAATIALLCTFVARQQPPSAYATPASWSVTATAGLPRVGARSIAHETPFRLGQWLETDSTARALVTVGSIGELRVEPNSRLRLAGTAAHDHRIKLARGTVDALIWAPPRLFFVDTPSATAVDLGCAYTLTVDDDGNGELHVTAGYVALEHGDRESIIPSGLKCITRRGAGPGTPFAAEAPAALRAALEAFDFGPASARGPAFDALLALARPEDAVTLWHVLGRTRGAQRASVFDALARHAPPPEGVTRAGILAGDTTMRRAWGTALGLGTFDAP